MQPTISSETFSRYFNDTSVPELAEIVQKAFLRLQEGHIATILTDEETALLEPSRFVTKNTQNLDCPFIIHNNKFYFQRYFLYETQILHKIQKLYNKGKKQEEERKRQLEAQKSFIHSLFSDFVSEGPAPEHINWQMAAALNSMLEQFSIITGGPGTGKTTTVAKLLAVLYNNKPDIKVTLAAQTGKAAARLKESLNNSKKRLILPETIKRSFDKIQPVTIHRLLGYIPGSIDFKHNENNQLDFDVIIIDESSMIDVPLMAKLFNAIHEESRIILLGDKNQLASVEAGSIFGDLCKSIGDEINIFDDSRIETLNKFIETGKIDSNYSQNTPSIGNCIAELKKSYRFSGHTGIGQFAKEILIGNNIAVEQYSSLSEAEGVFIQPSHESAECEQYFSKFKDYITEKDISEALIKLNNVKILCATRNGINGVEEMNALVEKYLRNKKLIRTRNEFYKNRPILITKNDYSLGLYNGDVGICRENEEGQMRVYFEDSESENGLKAIIPSFIQSFETVYAMTIHKSQGSEFDHIVMTLPPSGKGEALLTRELVYTGITRGKQTVLLITDETVLNEAINTPVERVSGIIDRL